MKTMMLMLGILVSTAAFAAPGSGRESRRGDERQLQQRGDRRGDRAHGGGCGRNDEGREHHRRGEGRKHGDGHGPFGMRGGFGRQGGGHFGR